MVEQAPEFMVVYLWGQKTEEIAKTQKHTNTHFNNQRVSIQSRMAECMYVCMHVCVCVYMFVCIRMRTCRQVWSEYT